MEIQINIKVPEPIKHRGSYCISHRGMSIYVQQKTKKRAISVFKDSVEMLFKRWAQIYT